MWMASKYNVSYCIMYRLLQCVEWDVNPIQPQTLTCVWMFCTVCLYLADIQHCADHTRTTQHCAIWKPGTVTLTVLDMPRCAAKLFLLSRFAYNWSLLHHPKTFKTAGLLFFTRRESFSRSNCIYIYNTPTEMTLFEFWCTVWFQKTKTVGTLARSVGPLSHSTFFWQELPEKNHFENGNRQREWQTHRETRRQTIRVTTKLANQQL